MTTASRGVRQIFCLDTVDPMTDTSVAHQSRWTVLLVRLLKSAVLWTGAAENTESRSPEASGHGFDGWIGNEAYKYSAIYNDIYEILWRI